MPKLFEGLVDKLVVSGGARDTQALDDELAGFRIRKFRDGYASYFVKFNVGRQQRRKTARQGGARQPEADALDDA